MKRINFIFKLIDCLDFNQNARTKKEEEKNSIRKIKK